MTSFSLKVKIFVLTMNAFPPKYSCRYLKYDFVCCRQYLHVQIMTVLDLTMIVFVLNITVFVLNRTVCVLKMFAVFKILMYLT